MSRLSLLLVAQLAPPSTLVAARRVAGMTKYLARLGIEVTVLTSAVSGDGEIEGARRVVRTRDLLATGLNWRRRHFRALAEGAPETYRRPSRMEAVVVPDLAAPTWLPFALSAARSLAREGRFSAVLTTSPPPSAHLVGVALARSGVPWIAELRDGWTFEPPRPPWPLAAQRRLDGRLERLALARAAAVVAVTEPIAEDLRARLGVQAEVITNGYDPEEVPAADARDPDLDPRRYSLVHTGRMAIARSTPAPLVAALRRLRRQDPEAAGRLEVVFAGPVTDDERALLSAPDLDGVVRLLGPVERPRALRLQRAADALLVVTEGSRRRSVATGKLFEYLAARRPILVLGEDTEAARIVERCRTGFATSAGEPDAIATALHRLVAGDPQCHPDEVAIGDYAYPALAARLAAVVETVSRA